MKYFTIAELCASTTAKARGIDNTPTEEVRRNLEALVENVLDPLREAWGSALKVNSGYRSAALNKAVGGATKSQHLTGCAADITTGTTTGNRRLFELARSLRLPYYQLIDEYGYQWVHISYNGTEARRELHLGKSS
jgi:hypothetical protein